MLTGPPPKFHGTWDILARPLRAPTAQPRVPVMNRGVLKVFFAYSVSPLTQNVLDRRQRLA